jgi:hypothetical protein
MCGLPVMNDGDASGASAQALLRGDANDISVMSALAMLLLMRCVRLEG